MDQDGSFQPAGGDRMKNVQEIIVKVTYRDKELNPTYTKTYTLPEYADSIRSDLQSLVGEVETLGYLANGNKPKEEWSDASFATFTRIKHKLLDKAGEIGRLPSNMMQLKREPLSSYVAQILNGEEDEYGESSMGSGD